MRRLVNGAYSQVLHPFTLSVSMTLGSLSKADAQLPHEDEIADLDWVEVETPDGEVGYYRVSEIETDMGTGRQRVQLEHGACTLRDYVIDSEYKQKKTIAQHLAYILGKQPQTASPKWTVGTVEATDTVYLSLRGDTLYSSIDSMMESIPGYQAVYSQTGSAWTVNILSRPQDAVCEARLSRNMTGCKITYETGSLCTRVIAKGLTGGHLDSVNIGTYGIHEHDMTLNDGLSAAQKLATAQAYLDAHDHPEISVSISGVELSRATGLSLDAFRIGTVCRVVIPWLNVEVNEVITEKSYSDCLAAPETVKLTLANARPDLSYTVASTRSGGRRTAKAAQEAVTSIEQIVSAVGEDGEVTVASVITRINEQTGEGQVLLHGDQIDLDGYVTAINLTADSYIGADIIEAKDIFYAHDALKWVGGGGDDAEYSSLMCQADLEERCVVMNLSLTGTPATGFLLEWDDFDYTHHSVPFNYATTLTGAWDSGSYIVTASPQGNTHTNSPTVNLTGSGGTSFSANIVDFIDDDREQHPTPTVVKSTTGYLAASGRTVTVYTSYDGTTYSGAIASKSVLSHDVYITDKTPEQDAAYADQTLYRKKADGTFSSYIAGSSVYVFTATTNMGSRHVYY